MGFIRQKMKVTLDALQTKSWNSSADEAVIPYVIAIDCSATGASTFTYKLTNKVKVIDAMFIVVAANGGATAQVQDTDGNAITDAVSIATNKAIVRAGEIDDDNYSEAKGNNLKVVQNANSDSCLAFITVIPIK